MKSTPPVSHYSLIWGWIKNSVFLTFMALILILSVANVRLTYISITTGKRLVQNEHEKYRRIVSQLIYEICEIRDRHDVEVSAAADWKRAYIWRKIKKRNKWQYKKQLRYLRKKYPDLVGEYDENWDY